MCPSVAKIASLLPRTVSIMVLSWTEQATSAKQTWTCLPLCSPLESSGSNRLLNMILSGLITWSSTKHKPRPGRTSPPRTDDLVKTVLATNDSAPGPDGIPFAAWRLHPGTSSEAMATHLNDTCRSAVPPCSVQAWIPKAKMGPTADNFRPLGMPSTFERVIDGSIATVMTKAIAPLLHPSQTDSIEPLSGTTKCCTIGPICP